MSRFFSPCTQEELAEKIWKASAKMIEDARMDDDEPDIFNMFKRKLVDDFIGKVYWVAERRPELCWCRGSKLAVKDIVKVTFDHEEACLLPEGTQDGSGGFHTLDNGLTYLGVYAGGGWEVSLFYIIYWDGKNLRAYIPKDGNPWNTDTGAAYTCDDLLNAQKRFGKQIKDEDDLLKLKVNMPSVIADIKARILPKP